jgi:hypothetical protein
MDGTEIESRWDKIFRAVPHRLRDTPSLLYKEYQVYFRVYRGRGEELTSSSSEVVKGLELQAYPALPSVPA